MPIEHAIWRMGDDPKRLTDSTLKDEGTLEDLICKDVAVLNEQWLLVGRQVSTAYGGRIDLMAMDDTGSIVVVELKRNRTPREVVAQALDYATWVKGIDAAQVARIFEDFSARHLGKKSSLGEAFREKFSAALRDEQVNSSRQIVVVAADLDSSTERIVRYLNDDYGVPVNVATFRVFKDGSTKYLSRAWLVDPWETKERATAPVSSSSPWNGEFYVSFGHEMGRHWDDAREYGFVGGGGGRWYSRTLRMLKEGDRVWVNIPRRGYVGVGRVTGTVMPASEFMVETESGKKSLLDASDKAHYHKKYVDNPDRAEYVVPVEWIRAVPLSQAKSEVGFFGNQNTVCRPTTEAWNHTVERLKELFKVE